MIIIGIILLIIILLLSLNNENFIDFYYNTNIIDINKNNYKIDYHVIHISSKLNRQINVQMMTNKINKYINKFEAIKGSDLLDDNDTNNIDLNKLVKYDKNLTLKYFYEFINEIGCYLSHVVLIKSLFKTNFKYTVIFEDDFIIVNDNFNEELDTILDSITEDFDILFIGNTVNNHGKQYKNNIYYIDDTNILWGTQGYVINNKNILKIYNNIMCIDNPIDVKYKDLIDKQILKGFVIYPIIVSIMYTESTIRI